MPRSRAIVVLGMHRNGTSLLTRGLQALDVYLGNDFLASKPDNPTGYWEDRFIHQINERLLAFFGLKWQSIQRIDDRQWRDADLKPLRREAKEHLRAHFIDHPTWGFKDPRTNLLLPFWRPIFEALDVDDRYIVAIRNPLSVARSLHRRQYEISLADGHLLWLLYMVPCLSRIAGRPFVVVDYDRLMADAAGELARVARHLELPMGESQQAALAAFARDFVQPGLRHHHFTPDDFDTMPRLAPATREAYLRLLQLAADEVAPDAGGFGSAWERLTSTAAGLFDEAAARKREEAAVQEKRREAAARFVFRSGPKFPDVRLFVVTGTQRTGTNLLRELLNTNRSIAMVAEILTPCVPPGHKLPEPPYPDQSPEEAASSYQLPGMGPGPQYPGLNHRGYWGNFLRTLPAGAFPAETPADGEKLLDRYFDFLLELIRNQWVGGDKVDVRAIGVDIKYSHLHRLAPRQWDPSLPPFLLGYLRSRGALLIHALRRNLVHCTVSALAVNRTGICHNYAKKEMDGRFAIDLNEFLVYARRIVSEREAFLRHAGGFDMVEYEYEDLAGELARADASSGQIAPGNGPLSDIARALGVPYQFVYSGRLEKTINIPYDRLLSNREELVRGLEQTEFRELALTLN
jgi:hypothetical protein